MDDILFTGDSLIPGIKTITNLPRRNKTDAIKSEEIIKKLWKSCCLYPGHGEYGIEKLI